MNRLILLLLFFLLTGSCQQSATQKEAEDKKQLYNFSSYKFVKPTYDDAYNLGAGILFWKGKSLNEFHNGAIKLNDGSIYTQNNKISGAKVNIPISELMVMDIHDESKFEFEDHLKSSDFFNTSTYPNATIYIDELEAYPDTTYNYLARGILDMVGIKNKVEFPINFKMADEKLFVESDHFVIDRTQWGLNYKSTVLGVPLDQVIQDEIRLKFKFYAYKVK